MHRDPPRLRPSVRARAAARAVAVAAAAAVGLIPGDAGAIIYNGNPNLGFRVDRPAGDYLSGSVTVDKVRVHHCAGGYTDHSVNDTIDPVDGYTMAIPSGDECGLTFYWSSALTIDGDGALGAFTVSHSGSTTSVTLEDEIPPTLLGGCTVTSGQMSGGCPWLLVHID